MIEKTPSRLLILDAEPMAGRAMSDIARSVGLTCELTPTASQFFEALDAWAPTHVILDLVLPDTDGVEVLVKLASLNCRASIIIASSMERRILVAAQKTGKEHGLLMIGLLSKPISVARLRAFLLAKVEPIRASTWPASKPPCPEKNYQVSAEDFKLALINEELELVYQPKINCRNDQLAGFEALVRWNCPKRGLLLPDAFIPIAEASGLMVQMTRQVITQAVSWFCNVLASLEQSTAQDSQRSAFIQELSLCINLSARSLDDPQFIGFVSQQCQQAGIEPRRIVFELTESSELKDPVAALKVLTQLRVRGFRLSMDDFGAGFSSMTRLMRLPFSDVKLDRSFVMAAFESEESRTVIRAVIELSHSLNLLATGEGVEDLSTFKYLCQTDCDLVQGFLFSRPISGVAAMDWGHAHLESWR